MIGRIRFISIAVLVVSLALLAASFATSDRGGRTRFGSSLGADYAGFYTAGWILNHRPAVALYDREIQDRIHHELHPHLEPNETLPFLHPPFVAVAFRPLAELPYAWSFALWLVISLGFYLGGVWITLRTTILSQSDRLTALLAALSFEPFVMEGWQGGQLSAVGFFCLALALALDHSGRRFGSGLALGLCLYKPTLLVLIVPILVFAGRWRTLLGVAATGIFLFLLTWASVGWEGGMAFVDKLLGFSRAATESSPLALRTWKYVDLNAFTRLLLDGPGTAQKILFAVLALPVLALLLARAWSLNRCDEASKRLIWAAVLIATPAINLYVGIYDSVLAALGSLLFIDATVRVKGSLSAAARGWLAALYVSPWITQPLARHLHFQVMTMVMLGFAVWICWGFTSYSPRST